MIRKLSHIDPSLAFLLALSAFFIIYTEIQTKQKGGPPAIIVSDAQYYHEYIAVHLYGMEPYIPRDKKPVIKYSMGMAVTYMPGIAAGYLVSELKGLKHDYGRNYVYQRILYYFGFIYCLLGLLFLRLILKRWIDGWIVAFVLALIFFGTNLYYYVKVMPLMSHAASFAFITAFIHYCLRLFEKPTLRSAAGIGIFLALLTLIRPTNIVVVLFPIAYLLVQKKTMKEKLGFIKKHILYWLLIIICMVTAFLPQMIYWHHYTGEWLYYSYRQEKFFWAKPALLQILFSFRKGWLVYTPLMVFIIPGAVITYRKNKTLFWAVMIFFLVNTYIVSCWWCWWYGGCFGMRPIIDSYGILAIWIGFFLQYLWQKTKPVWVATLCVMGFFTYVNLYQTRQARINVIHYDAMSYPLYKKVFLKETPKDKEWESLLDPPDYEKAFTGERFW